MSRFFSKKPVKIFGEISGGFLELLEPRFLIYCFWIRKYLLLISKEYLDLCRGYELDYLLPGYNGLL